MNLPWVYMCSTSWMPPPPPSLSHPSGSSQCNSPKHPVSCIEPELAICYTYDNIHVSIPFSQIIPPSPSPTRVQKTVLYICVYISLSCVQGYCYHLSKFHIICISILYWCFSFWLTSLCIIGSSFIHLIRTDSNVSFEWLYMYCVYVPQLSYPFICLWASSLLPCLGYYKQCCDEHWGYHVSFNSGFLSVYAQEWNCWVIWQFYFQFFKESPHCPP